MNNIDTDQSITPTTVYPGGIEVFENIWLEPHKTIITLEKECENANTAMHWERSDVKGIDGYSGYGEARTNLEIKLTEIAEAGDQFSQALHNQIADMMDDITISYMIRHKIYGIKYHHEFYHILKYSNDQKFDAHVDGMPGGNRFLSAILYLNDDYEGGELEFINFNLKLKLKPGSLIVFPSYFSYAHTAHPVTAGNKYAIVAWLGLGNI